MNSPRRAIRFFCFTVAFASGAPAQDQSATNVTPDLDEAIDEIVVVGEKSMLQLKQEVYRSEEDFFSLFSELNEDDEFDVRCFYETPSFTRIRNHVCRARFVTDAYSAAAVKFRTEGPRYPTRDPALVVSQKSKALEEKLTALVATNPELQEALNRYTNAKSTYLEERARRFGDEPDDNQ